MLLLLEAIVRRFSVKKVFLKILKNSHENTCARAPFLIKFQALAYNFIKKETLAQVFSFEFCEILRNFTSFLLNTSSGCFYTATWGHFSRLLLHHHCKHQIWLVFEMNNVRKWSNTL